MIEKPNQRNFQGRPDYDKGNTSDSEQQFQREGLPYDQRIFKPKESENFEKKTIRKLNIGGSVDDDGRPFVEIGPEETLDDGTRQRIARIRDRKGNIIFEISDDPDKPIFIKGIT